MLLLYFAAYLIADTKPAKPAIKSSTLPRTASQGKNQKVHIYSHVTEKNNLLDILFTALSFTCFHVIDYSRLHTSQ